MYSEIFIAVLSTLIIFLITLIVAYFWVSALEKEKEEERKIKIDWDGSVYKYD